MNVCPQPAASKRNSQKSLKISCKARYALRILKDIADHQGDSLPTTEAAISQRQGLSQKFLSRIVLPLRDAGFITARRGSRAGFSLLKKPEDITILEIVEAAQGPVLLLDCLDKSVPCPHKRGCFARIAWGKVNDGLRASLAGITLAEVQQEESPRKATKTRGKKPTQCP